jgi:predicted flap endonuclease-1-like 5' DNA nuclease
MIYLIGQLSIWLLLTAAFAAVAGWAWAAERSSGAERSLRRDRDNLMRDLIKLAQGEGGSDSGGLETERETDATRRLLEIRDARIAELEQAAETARASANDAAGQVAELQRRLENTTPAENDELIRLRAAAAERARTDDDVIDAEIAPAIDEEAIALQTWRLRYFEQRVRYLEGLAREAAPQAASEPAPNLPLQWRARDAEARATFLEQELRQHGTPAPAEARQALPAAEEPPFAADADVDVLLRWRLLYLERRVAYLQEEVAQDAALPVAGPAPEAAPDPDRWKWRARYLEARVRHLEQRPSAAQPAPAQTQAAAQPAAEAAQPAPRPSRRGVKPAVLAAARNGAPDDFTLIEGVSLLQQSTLYSIGVFHFDQVAAWSPDNVAWIDHYLRLGGRIEEEEWVEQAADLTRDGPAAARRVLDSEDL